MNAVLITGTNRGIGLELTKCYLAAGREVTDCCRQPEQAEAFQKMLAEHTRLRLELVDVGVANSVRAVHQTLAVQPLYILINYAGVTRPYPEHAPPGQVHLDN